VCRRLFSRALAESFDIAWWRKDPDELSKVLRERNRSKIGRMARLKGSVETVAPPATLALPAE
jgi:hypothetical protein